LPGVVRFDISAQDRIDITYDDRQASREQILKALREGGVDLGEKPPPVWPY